MSVPRNSDTGSAGTPVAEENAGGGKLSLPHMWFLEYTHGIYYLQLI